MFFGVAGKMKVKEMTSQEKDATVAERIMGWHKVIEKVKFIDIDENEFKKVYWADKDGNYMFYFELWHPSGNVGQETSLYHCHLMELHLEEMGLAVEYGKQIMRIFNVAEHESQYLIYFDIIHALPSQKVDAAMRAVEG